MNRNAIWRHCLTWLALSAMQCGVAAATPPLALEGTIALPHTSGRIDHLAIDLARKRLFVAELGNGSVDVVDVTAGTVLHRIDGLSEPQGVAFVAKSDLLVIASGGDGTLRIFGGNDFAPRGVVRFGADADNLHLDPHSGAVVVGHGSGGLAVVDPATAVTLKDIPLPDHPEGYQLASDGKAYVNVPNAHQIDVVDLNAGKLVARWTTPNLAGNFPLALGDGNTAAVVFRSPARLVRFELTGGRPLTETATCGDADDVFFDTKRQRYYISCGTGLIDVLQLAGGAVSSIASVPTAAGGRTSLFVPELDRLFLAVRAGLLGSDASIQIFRPMENRQ